MIDSLLYFVHIVCDILCWCSKKGLKNEYWNGKYTHAIFSTAELKVKKGVMVLHWCYIMMCHFVSFIILDSRCNQTRLHLHLHRPWCPSPDCPTSQTWCRWRGPPRAGEPAAGCQQWDLQLCGGETNTCSAQAEDWWETLSDFHQTFEGNSA